MEMDKREATFTGIRLTRSDDGDGRTVEGIAVPYGDVIDTWDGRETFDPDCKFDGLDNAKLLYQHGELIGRILSGESREDGLHITARISNTALGRDVAELLSDGSLDSFSVGFVPMKDHIDDDGVIHRKKVRLLETSLVSFPAYENANVKDVRSKTNTTNERNRNMENENNAELNERLSKLEEQTRSIATDLAHNKPSKPVVLGEQWRSNADYLRDIAAAKPEAVEFMKQTRDLMTTVDGSNMTVWLADMIQFVQSHRTVSNMITSASLPSDGMSVSYNRLKTDGMKVGKQTKEGDALTFGKIEMETATADINTYGGYTQLSRQEVERSTTPALENALKALTLAYADATEQAVRDALYSLISAHAETAALKPGKALTAMTAYDWADIIIDGAETLDGYGLTPTVMGVSKDVFKSLVRLTTSGDRFLDINGGNTLGSLDVTGVAGNLMRVQVQLMPNAPTNTAAFIDKSAVTMWESGGPTQLTATDPTTATSAYSIYGYMAIGVTNENGILPVKFGA